MSVPLVSMQSEQEQVDKRSKDDESEAPERKADRKDQDMSASEPQANSGADEAESGIVIMLTPIDSCAH